MDSRAPIPPRSQRRGQHTLLLVQALLYLVFATLALLVLRRLAVVVAPLVTGLFLAYLLNPWLTRLERRGLPRPLGIVVLLALSFGALTGLALLLPPLLSHEFERFAERWHDYALRLETVILPWLRHRLHLPRDATHLELTGQTLTRLQVLLQSARGDVATAIAGALHTATGVLRLLLAALLTPVFAIYFLSDFPKLRSAARELVPPRRRRQVLGIVSEINHALAAWVGGQLMVMFILGTLYATGLALAGVPLGVVIGIVTGLMAFVPYVGVSIGLCLALLAALLDPQPAGALVGVLATFAAVQALDGLIVTPRVLGGRVGLSPVAVIFALTLGGELLGYVGVILAVPTAAVCKVLLAHARATWMESRTYLGDEAPGDGEGRLGDDDPRGDVIQPAPSDAPPLPRAQGGSP